MRAPLGLGLLLALLGACTFLTRFDQEGQPCDKDAPACEQCKSGFACHDDKCMVDSAQASACRDGG